MNSIELEFAEVELPAIVAAQFSSHCGPQSSDIGAAMGPAFGALMAGVQQQGLVPAGPPRTIYHAVRPTGFDFTVAMPVASAGPGATAGAVTVGTLPGGKFYRFTHRGAYQNLADTYRKIGEYLTARGWMASEADWVRFMPMFEEYQNDPSTTAEAELRTYIYLPRPA